VPLLIAEAIAAQIRRGVPGVLELDELRRAPGRKEQDLVQQASPVGGCCLLMEGRYARRGWGQGGDCRADPLARAA